MTSPSPERHPDRPRQCFVIGPIGNPHATHGSPERAAYEHHLEVFEEVIAPACAKFAIAALRADGIASPGDINEQICRHVINSDLVVADVSGGNPNVMYELGLRHLGGRPIIHIGEDGQLPFDIASVRIIRYQRTRTSLAGTRRRIEDALAAGIQHGFELLTPARVLRAIQLDSNPAPDRSTDPPPEEDDDRPGLLDDFAAVEQGLAELTGQLGTLAGAVETVGTLTARHNAEMLDLVQANAPASARFAAVARLADALIAPATEMHTTAQEFSAGMAVLDSGIRTALEIIETTAPEELDQDALEFLEQLVSLDEGVRAGFSELSTLITAVGRMHLMSRRLRGPAKAISGALQRLHAVVTRVNAWADRARGLLPVGTG
ncbi:MULTISPECIES: hypothetical protein [Kitasatospora]|uniref:Uncharacterized protein n=1 Tax=Kitasatospora setae (strain ATCC 33774 / DSM 43861 / JCM 3304 / KCC A-0304 / NBRC 14216 / KM-6054) TaxID=452652 RepID=E4N604_KITSK|nr:MULTISPECIES: hypothetical protein [Kitasatospora]BAJ26635.1 hypothetical protein KSE_07960 [Kitasatospora setae KM-6054]